MNTRILRMCERSPLASHWIMRRVKNMGQLQPVIFSIERGGPSLRIEGAVDGRPCWHVLPLPRYKARAKDLFAELEEHKAAGTDAPAAVAWRARASA